MSDSFKYQFSIKTPAGSMLNVRADSADEFTANLQAAGATVALCAGLESALIPASTVGHAGAAAPPAQQATRPLPPRSDAAGRSCVHGPMVHRTGVGSRGPWEGYFCPTPKGTPDQCKAQFV